MKATCSISSNNYYMLCNNSGSLASLLWSAESATAFCSFPFLFDHKITQSIKALIHVNFILIQVQGVVSQNRAKRLPETETRSMSWNQSLCRCLECRLISNSWSGVPWISAFLQQMVLRKTNISCLVDLLSFVIISEEPETRLLPTVILCSHPSPFCFLSPLTGSKKEGGARYPRLFSRHYYTSLRIPRTTPWTLKQPAHFCHLHCYAWPFSSLVYN